MYFFIGIIIFFIMSFKVKRNNKRAYHSFIAESAPDQKQEEIVYFQSDYKAAKTKEQKQEVAETQASYWHYFTKARKLKYWAFGILILGAVIELMIWITK